MTAQFTDSVVYEGKKRTLASPLNCEKHLLEDNPDNSSGINTANWKGYLVTWEIKDNKLFLNEVDGQKRMRTAGPLFADWHSGCVAIATGEFLSNLNDLYSLYEEEIHLNVAKGIVVEKHEIKKGIPTNKLTQCKHCRLLLYYQGIIEL